jgi:large subunit ribosomal protein L23
MKKEEKKKEKGMKAGLKKGMPAESQKGLKTGIGKEKKERPKEELHDPWRTLLYPHMAEKSMIMVELQNKLTFIVKRKASKKEIAEEVERGFNVEVRKVNVEGTMKGAKKAYVTLSPKHSAADIATRLGMI